MVDFLKVVLILLVDRYFVLIEEATNGECLYI